jgi:hypothetical protein
VGGLEIGVLQADFADILSLPEASIVDASGNVLPWLEWLLLRGDQIIIAGHQIQFGNFPNSRSGNAIMIEDDSQAWRIPPIFSGVINDNWLTRVLDQSMRVIEDLFTRIVERHLKAALRVI